MSKPIFVCVPGASHPAIIYDPIKASLALHGYTAVPVQLPSTSSTVPNYDFTEDVAVIRHIISRYIESGSDVIVVLHGWSGVVGGEALQGLGKAERTRRGLRGGVVRIVFIMAWIVKEGFQGAQRGDCNNMFPHLHADLQTGTATPIPTVSIETLFSDMAPQQAHFWASRLQPQSLGVFWSTTTYAAWRYIPTTYVYCGQDRSVTVEYAEMMVQTAKDSIPNMIDCEERCEDGGHEVMITRVSWTVDMLLRAAAATELT